MSQEEVVHEFRHMLQKPFEYTLGGDMATAQFIELRAPTSKHLKHTAKLKQSFMRAMKDMASESDGTSGADSDGDAEMDGSKIVMFIAMSDVDLGEFLMAGRDLLAADGIAFVDGETKMKYPLVDKLSQDDLEMMIGGYLANFTLASTLAAMSGG